MPTNTIDVVHEEVAVGGYIERDPDGLWVFPTVLTLSDGRRVDLIWGSSDADFARTHFASLPHDTPLGLMVYEPDTGDVVTRLL